MKQTITCSTHGLVEWKRTICCEKCLRVYQVVIRAGTFIPICQGAKQAPLFCECGSRLPGEGGSARAICTQCFIGRVEQNKDGGS